MWVLLMKWNAVEFVERLIIDGMINLQPAVPLFLWYAKAIITYSMVKLDFALEPFI